VDSTAVRVLLVADHASARFGGEAVLPLHYFRNLRARGVEAWLVVHERTRAELAELLKDDLDRVHFVPDTGAQRWLSRAFPWAPPSIRHFTVRLLGRVLSQRVAKRAGLDLIHQHQIQVVHQPIPVSPREFSLLHFMGAPVVIGPMNGGMTLPRCLRNNRSPIANAFVAGGRIASIALNWIFPGKLLAHTLLVANDRTKRALPPGVRGRVVHVVENGVHLPAWPERDYAQRSDDAPIRFIFSGRLEEWKGVQFLLHAFHQLREHTSAKLTILGDGFVRPRLEALSRELQLQDHVEFLGWKPQAQCSELLRGADVFVIPSYYECGGAVVLEAMASALPVIAANWGGPADYITPACGILVDIESREAFVASLAQAMLRLATNASLRESMGRAGRARVIEHFTWTEKTEQILDVYDKAIADQRATQPHLPPTPPIHPLPRPVYRKVG
jgi:glycosyltransferase involved in cell wall biosynthesis